MSKNNNRSGNKDVFVKPGDENIVSGKPFFLSFGKAQKGPANPLIESEKNKAENKNSAQNKGDAERTGGSQNFRKGGKKHRGHQKPPVKNQPEEKQQSAQSQNAPEKSANNRPTNERPGRNNKKKNGKFDRRQDRHQGAPEKTQDTAVQAAPVKAANPEQKKNRPEDRNARRQKHKKEKFIPTAPQNEKEEELLQPIVDRTEILSGARSSFATHSKGIFSSFSSKKTEIETGDEPRYIDRNIPLAQQIAEQSKPKTYKHDLPEGTETVEVIGVRFREAGKVYYFDPGENKVKKDTPVIVETARGVEYGFCAIANRHVSTADIVAPLKPIIRIATKEDTERYNGNKELEESAAKIFKEKVRQLGLEMSLVYVEYTFDNGKLLFYFTADGRVDFRELIKELASAFRTRIELRQIGVRDEAKIVGGLGICGRPVCCKSFLGEFSQVSIKMAKDQNLFINSSKISGTCGRFMCCIRYEDEVYQKEYEKTPKVDAIVETPEGRGVVTESNALKGMVKVLLDDKPEAAPAPFKCTEVKLLGYAKKENDNEIPEGMEIPEGE